MYVRILGDVVAESDGTPVAIGGRTQRRLLAILAINRGRSVSVERLAQVTWPDSESRSTHTIRTYVHRLRNSLGEHGELLRTVDTGYQLDLDGQSVDASELERIVEAGLKHFASDDLHGVLGRAAEAEELWRSAPLQEFADESWVLPEAARLTDLFMALLTAKGESLLTNAKPDEAVRVLKQVAEEVPLREEPCRLLMRALYESGRPVEATRAFQTYRETVIDLTGLEPSSSLFELDQSIVNGSLDPLRHEPRRLGAYEMHEPIGSSAIAVVHRATQPSLGRQVAIKAIRPDLANNNDFIRGFEAEAQLVARLEHPNIVPLLDYWREPDAAYLVSRWMTGGTLADRLNQTWLLEDVLGAVESIASALDAAHQLNVVHGSLTVDDVLLDEADNVLVANFGIGQESNGGKSGDIESLAGVTRLLLDRVEDSQSGRASQGLDFLAHFTGGGALDMANGLRDSCEAKALQATANSVPCPYVGIASFEADDAGRFFGREALVAEVIDHMTSEMGRLTMMVGPSGSGKSSALRAGVVPALRDGAVDGSEKWLQTQFMPGKKPLEALETSLLRVASQPAEHLLEQLRDGSRGLIRAARRVVPSDDQVVLLVIDQFEELYSPEVDPSERDHFLSLLSDAVSDDSSNLRVIATLRADFFHKALNHAGFANSLRHRTIAIAPLSIKEATRAIVAPAEGVGVSVEPALVSELVSHVADSPTALPFFQFALTEVFRVEATDVMTLRSYEEIGSMAGALGRSAERIWESLDNDAIEASARRVFGRLVTLGEGVRDTRRRVPLSELGTDRATSKVLERFGDARLISFDRDPSSREPTAEITHEAIISGWPRMQRWLDEDRELLQLHRHLSSAQQEWDANGQNEEDLYSAGRLESALPLDSCVAVQLNDAEASFLNESRDFHQRAALNEKARVRRLRRLVAAIGALLVVSLAAGLLAFTQRDRANELAEVAEQERFLAIGESERAQLAAEEAKTAESEAAAQRTKAENTAYDAETSRLVATAASLADTNPREAVLLALAAYQRETSPETIGALQTTLTKAGPVLGAFGQGRSYADVEWIEGDRVVGVRDDGIDLFDYSTGELLDSQDLNTTTDAIFSGLSALRADSDGSRLAVVAQDEVLVFEVTDLIGEPLRLQTNGRPFAVAVTSDAVVASTETGAIQSWASDGTPLFELQENLGSIASDWPIEDEIPLVNRSTLTVHPTRLWPLFVSDGVMVSGTRSVRVLDPVAGTTVVSDRLGYYEVGRFGAPAMLTSELVSPSGRRYLGGPASLVSLDDGWMSEDRLVGTLLEGTLGAGQPNVVGWVLPDEQPMAVSDDGSLVTFDPLSGDRIRTVDLGIDVATSVAQTPGFGEAVVATGDGMVVISAVGAGPLSEPIPRVVEQNSASVSTSGRYVAAGSGGGHSAASLFERTDDGFVGVDLDLKDGFANLVSHSGPFDLFSNWSEDGTRFWRLDGTAPEIQQGFSVPGGSTGSHDRKFRFIVGFGPVFLAGTYDGSAASENLGSPSPAKVPTSARFSPSGSRALTATADGSAALFDTTTWEQLSPDPSSQLDIAIGAWNADESLFASASSNGTITIRDGTTFEPVIEMVGETGIGNAWADGTMFFSDDNATLLSNHDKSARLWDIETGRQIGDPFPSLHATNSGINIGPEGFQLVTMAEASILYWNLDIDSWPDIACKFADSELTDSEWLQWGPADTERPVLCGGQ